MTEIKNILETILMFINLNWIYIGLILFFGLLIYGIINLYKKLITFEKYYAFIYSQLVSVLNKMREIDNKQYFEQDEELGQLWIKISNIIQSLSNLFYDARYTNVIFSEELLKHKNIRNNNDSSNEKKEKE